MSKRVIITCTLVLLIGLMAGWDMLSHLLSGRLNLNIGVFFIPIGIGLFLGMPSARTAAVGVFSLTYLFCGFLLIASMFGRPAASLGVLGTTDITISGFSLVFVMVAMICSVSGLIHWMLYSQPFEDHLG